MLKVLIHCPFFCCVESQDLSKVKQTPKKNKQRLSTIWRRLMIITHQLSLPHKSVTPWAGLVQTKDFGFGSKQKDNNLCVNGAPCSAECLHSASIWVICFRGRGWIRARVSVRISPRPCPLRLQSCRKPLRQLGWLLHSGAPKIELNHKHTLLPFLCASAPSSDVYYLHLESGIQLMINRVIGYSID